MSMNRILIVEDDPYIRDALQELLQDEGYFVDCAPNGREGIDFLRSESKLPCLILLDLMMPVLDGYGFRREQTQDARLSGVPVIVMTANGRSDAKAFEAETLGFLRKPIDIDDLLGLVSRVCPNPSG
jgi:CheY-like chemotaxis protein